MDACVRNARWKYCERFTGELELYDLRNDRFELQNLAYEPAYEGLVTRLAARLVALIEE